MPSACSKITWLHVILSKLGYLQSSPTPLHAKNTSAIQIVVNPIFHKCTKHIEVDCHSIRKAFINGYITLPHISTNRQIADILTKSHLCSVSVFC